MGNRKNKKRYNAIKQKNDFKEQLHRYRSIKELANQGNDTKALVEIEDYLEIYPDDDLAKLLHGIILSKLKRIREAKSIFQELIDKNANTKYTAMYQLGCIAKIDGNYNLAKKFFKTNIKESPYEEDFSKIELSSILQQECKYEDAKAILNTVSDKRKNNALLQLSKIELLSGNLMESFNTISKISTDVKEEFKRKVSIQKGIIEANFSNYQYANEYFDEAMKGKKNSVYWKALLEKGKLENHFANYDKALEICELLRHNKSYSLNRKVDLLTGQIYENLNEYDKAEEYYKKSIGIKSLSKRDIANYNIGMLKIKENDKQKAILYLRKIKTNLFYKRAAILNIINIEIQNKEYKKAEEDLNYLLSINLITEDNKEYRLNKIQINKGLGKNNNFKCSSYMEKQYEKYSEEEAIKHIQERHMIGDKKSKFKSDIDIRNLFYEIKEKLKEENFTITPTGDVYNIEYKNIGYTVNGDISDLLKVLVIPNTKNIITMYPINGVKENKKKENPKVKRLSQIDKFNKKYNLK